VHLGHQLDQNEFVFAFYVSKFLVGCFTVYHTNSAAVFLPPFCGIASLTFTLVWIRPESMAKANALRRETNCVFQRIGTNAALPAAAAPGYC
jgi:hypothetical protein